MGKYALALSGAALVLALPLHVQAQAPADPPPAPAAAPPASARDADEVTNRVVAYTAWDDDFFYIAVQVNKPNLSGKNTKAFSHPLEDDAVIISFQTDDDHAADQTHRKVLFHRGQRGGRKHRFTPGRRPRRCTTDWKIFRRNSVPYSPPKKTKRQSRPNPPPCCRACSKARSCRRARCGLSERPPPATRLNLPCRGAIWAAGRRPTPEWASTSRRKASAKAAPPCKAFRRR